LSGLILIIWHIAGDSSTLLQSGPSHGKSKNHNTYKKKQKKKTPATTHNSRLSDAFVYKRENEVLEIYKL